MTEKEKDYAVFGQGNPNMADKLKDYAGFVNAVLLNEIPPEQAAVLFDIQTSPSKPNAKRRQLTDEELELKRSIVETLSM